MFGASEDASGNQQPETQPSATSGTESEAGAAKRAEEERLAAAAAAEAEEAPEAPTIWEIKNDPKKAFGLPKDFRPYFEQASETMDSVKEASKITEETMKKAGPLMDEKTINRTVENAIQKLLESVAIAARGMDKERKIANEEAERLRQRDKAAAETATQAPLGDATADTPNKRGRWRRIGRHAGGGGGMRETMESFKEVMKKAEPLMEEETIKRIIKESIDHALDSLIESVATGAEKANEALKLNRARDSYSEPPTATGRPKRRMSLPH